MKIQSKASLKDKYFNFHGVVFFIMYLFYAAVFQFCEILKQLLIGMLNLERLPSLLKWSISVELPVKDDLMLADMLLVIDCWRNVDIALCCLFCFFIHLIDIFSSSFAHCFLWGHKINAHEISYRSYHRKKSKCKLASLQLSNFLF